MDVPSLKAIVTSGGSVVVSANNYDVPGLKAIATVGKGLNCNLVIKNANKLDVPSCKAIASCNPGHVIFDFT